MAIPDNPRGSAVKAISGAIDALRTGEGLKGQLLRGGVGSIAVKIGSTLINVLLAIVLARTLGVEGFGVYSFVFALITIMAIPAQMGLPNLVVRETAKAQANGDWALMKGLWRWSTLMALAMSIALMALGAAAAWIFAAQLPEGGLAVFYWGLVLVPLIALGNLRGAALRGLRHVVQGQLPEFILRPAFLIVLVLGMHFGLSARTVTASDAMLLHAIASLAAFAIGAWMLLRARPGELRDAADTETRSGAWLKSAVLLAFMEGALVFNDNIGLLAFGVVSSVEEVAYLRISLQLGGFVTFGFLAINSIVAPYISKLFIEDSHVQLSMLMRRAAQLSTLAAIPVAMVFLCFGNDIIVLLFGENFSASFPALVVLSVGQLVNASTGCVGALLYMTGHESSVARAIGISSVLNLVLTFVLGAYLGIVGAALASALAMTLWNVLLFIEARRLTKIDSFAVGFSR